MIVRKVSMIVCFMMLLVSTSFAAPGVGRGAGRPHVDSVGSSKDQNEVSSKKESRPSMEGASLEKLQRSQAEDSTLSKLEISREQMKSLVRYFKQNSKDYSSFQRLIQAAHDAKTSEDRLVLRNYFQLLAFSGGEFHLSPSVLEERLTAWPSATKQHLGIVLESAAENARSGSAVTREDAFKAALKKFGLDSDYQKKCRRN